MIWMMLTIDIALAAIEIEKSIATRGEQIETLNFNPYCRDCDVPEGMDW